jgi:hypothetical protein
MLRKKRRFALFVSNQESKKTSLGPLQEPAGEL